MNAHVGGLFKQPIARWAMALALAIGLIGLATAQSFAETWPSRPIRMIVPYPAGGGTDAVARLVAKALSDRLQQAIVAENRGGANGAIGLQALKQANPDGYTIGVTADTSMTVNPWIYKNLPYDPQHDFIPVASVVRLPGMLAVHPSFPAHSVADLIALAKEKPGSISYASAGVGNFSHLAMELFSQAAGVKLLHVPYKGTGPASVGLLAGEVQVGFNNVQTLLPYIRAHQLVALAVAEPHRIPELPDLPAVAETVPGFEMAPWVGVFVPAGTPQDIVDKLSETTLAVMNDPVIAKQFADQQLTVMALPPKKFTDLIQQDTDKWGKVTKTAGIVLAE
jgi:tripartite-type tricarboxylate transporter receptor subunit TctC